jgi:hypothetical protein
MINHFKKNTTPVFFVGSGRSGTRTFFRMLSGTPGLEIHHEYGVPESQKFISMYSMGLISLDELKTKIHASYGSAITYSREAIWADSSNKLSWIIDVLAEMYPEAKFVAIFRDGRKVVASYFYKLREEMYDDASVEIISDWLDRSCPDPEPPAEKKYWWNIPRIGQNFSKEFNSFSRLERVAYHWTESNRAILDSFSRLDPSRFCEVRLEDVRADQDLLKTMIGFIGIKYDSIFYQYLQTPRNVFFPLDFHLTESQLQSFNKICAPMMQRLGYTSKAAYSVKY